MSFFNKDNLNKFKGQLSGAMDKAAEQGKKLAEQAQDAASKVKSQYGEVAADPKMAANKLQLDTLRGRVAQASTNWMSVYVDEMLNGVTNKDEWGGAKGIDALTSIKDLLTLAQARVTGVKDGEVLSNVIIQLGKVTSSKGEADAESLADLYITTKSALLDISELNGNHKVMAALAKGGSKEIFDRLVSGYDYEQRCAAVVAKCKPSKLAAIAADDTLNTLGINVNDALDADIAQGTDALRAIESSVYFLGDVANATEQLDANLNAEQKNAIYNLSEDIGTYNLSMSVSSNAMAYATHYSAQLSNGAKALAGQALGWYANRKNTPN